MNSRNRKNVTTYTILAVIVVIVLVLAIGSFGSVQSTSGRISEGILNENVYVLGLTSLQYVSQFNPSDSELNFTQITPELDTLVENDIIASGITPTTPYGFLLKIKGISKTKDNVSFEVEPATLTEALQFAQVNFQHTFQAEEILPEGGFMNSGKLRQQTKGPFYMSFDDFVVYDKDLNLQTSNDQVRVNGELSFNPTLDLDLLINESNLDHFKIALNLKENGNLQVEVGPKIKLFDVKIPISAPLPLHPIGFAIGPLPVVIVPVIQFFIDADGNISAEIEGNLPHSLNITAGYNFRNGKLEKIFEKEFNAYEAELGIAVGGDFNLSIGPSAQFKFYGLEGPSLSFLIDLIDFTADVTNNPWWEWYMGASIQFDLDFKYIDLQKFEADLISYRFLYKKADGPYSGPPISNSNADNDTEDSSSVISKDLSTVIVIDTSASMLDSDSTGVQKLEAAKKASMQILNVIEAENNSSVSDAKAGIISFNYFSYIEAPITSNIEQVKTSINELWADGGTGMPDGLEQGVNSLISQNKVGNSVIILLSDGIPNIGHGNDQTLTEYEVQQQVLNIAQRANENSICIYTVGFGIPFGIGDITGEPSIDEDFLKSVSNTAGCGQYYNAQNAIELANIYLQLRHVTTGNILFENNGDISQDEEIELGTVSIPNDQELMLFTLNWPGSQLEPKLVDPSGTLVDLNYPGASIDQGDSLSTVIIQKPLPGQWQLYAFGKEIPEGSTLYNAIVSSRPNPSIPIPVQENTEIVPVISSVSTPGAVVFVFTVITISGLVIFINVTRKGKSKSNLNISISDRSGTNSFYVASGNVVGRGTKADIIINDHKVSRTHARFIFSNNRWMIQDLDSLTGTYVNGKRINRVQQITKGDTLRIGDTKILVL